MTTATPFLSLTKTRPYVFSLSLRRLLHCLMMSISDSWRYRLAVASRALAAIGGGYALSAFASALLASLLPQSRVEATITATMLSLIIFCCAVLWVFAARNAWRAWTGIVVPTAVCALAMWLRGSLP
jgi:hypothetical protein